MKRNKVLTSFITGLLLFGAVNVGMSDSLEKSQFYQSIEKWKSIRTLENCKSIASTAKELKLGFPFDDVSRLRYNGFTFLVGRRIQDLNNSGLLGDANLKYILQDTINSISSKTSKEDWLNGYINYGALEMNEPELELDLLLAAITIANSSASIIDIEPFLKFSKVFFGSGSEAGMLCSIDSLVEETYNKDLTEEQHRKFWPASDAILSNPDVSIPLLVKAVHDDSLSELLRLRSAGFLMVMDKSILNELNLSSEPQIAKKIQCMIEAKTDWHGASTHICENLERYRTLKNKYLSCFKSSQK